jgi:hypothetical protein
MPVHGEPPPAALPPNLPPDWLADIKKAVRPSILLALLGSSVVASLITVVGGIYQQRTQFKIETERARSAEYREAYKTLYGRVRNLQAEMDNLTGTADVLLRYRRNVAVQRDVQASIKKVAEQMAGVFRASRDPKIGPGIAQRVARILDPLSVRLSAAQKAKNNLGPIRELVDRYKSQWGPDIRDLMSDIDAKMQTFSP